jgi:hypothetical protein
MGGEEEKKPFFALRIISSLPEENMKFFIIRFLVLKTEAM